MINKISSLFRGGSAATRRKVLPTRVWYGGLLTLTLIVAVGSTVSGSLFFTYSTITLTEGESSVRLPNYNERLVEEMLTAYQDVRTQHQTIRQSTGQAIVTSTVATSTATSSVGTVNLEEVFNVIDGVGESAEPSDS